MTFQPIVPMAGIAGYLFVERTQAAQQDVFNKSPEIAKDVAHFKENIAKATTAEALVNDYRLFRVALGAFGLEDEISKKFFLQKILSEGTEDPQALGNKLVDPRYRELAQTFGYGNFLGAQVGQPDFAAKITAAYEVRQFEAAVGNSDNSIRLAMNLKREISTYANSTASESSAWFQVMGNTPLRTVFETAFALPTSVGALDIDRQLEIFQEKSEQFFGSSGLEVFQDPENVDTLIRNFLAQSQITNGPTASTKGYAALSLLQAGQLGSTSTANLLISSF